MLVICFDTCLPFFRGADQSAEFFNSSNSDAMVARQAAAQQAMDALKAFIGGGNEVGRVGIYDATNTTKARRDWIMEELKDVVHSKSHVVFVEIICEDESVIDNNIRTVKATMPDYKGKVFYCGLPITVGTVFLLSCPFVLIV